MRASPIILAAAAILLPAAASAGNYSASIAAAPVGHLVVRDVLWSCAAGTCSGASDYSRPLIVCQSLARKAGKIDSFRVDGRPFAAAELERCNANARPAAAGAAAPVASGN